MNTGIVTEYVINKIKSGATDIAADYISALPILFGVSIGVYALLGMISKTLAKFSVVGVFVYGAVIVII